MTDTTLRARLARPPILIAPGIYDPLTALNPARRIDAVAQLARAVTARRGGDDIQIRQRNTTWAEMTSHMRVCGGHGQ